MIRKKPQNRMVILIDEIEAHLHPKWQRKILSSLLEVQRELTLELQVQFLVATHSPHWIPHSAGNHSIDHFIPKAKKPKLAYEWSNFRYVAARFNSRKGTRDILDPFTISPNQFIIDFKSLYIKPHSDLSPEQKTTFKRISHPLQSRQPHTLRDFV